MDTIKSNYFTDDEMKTFLKNKNCKVDTITNFMLSALIHGFGWNSDYQLWVKERN
jgi:hypothetical protein